MTEAFFARDSKDNIEAVWLRDFYPGALVNLAIHRSPEHFLPDAWTQALACGLTNLSQTDAAFDEKTFLEVGVGTGINMAGLLTMLRPPRNYIGVDLCDTAVNAAGSLARAQGWKVKLMPSDLLSGVENEILKEADHIVACIPQVPAQLDLSEADNAAHYYKPDGNAWDTFGLGLNARLLQQISERAPHAAVTLNLSGRPGENRLRDLFKQYGYAPEITHMRMVRQHRETSLASLAALEDSGCSPFEFFKDGFAFAKLNASQAEERRKTGRNIYHRIYVMTAAGLK